MKMFRFACVAFPLGALLSLSGVVPANALPAAPGLRPAVADVQLVQYKPQPGYWHGYRGSRTELPGTRRHSDGLWYPLAAFGIDPGATGSIGAREAMPKQREGYCQNTFGGTNGDGSMPCDNGF